MMMQGNNGGKPKGPALRMPQGFNGEEQEQPQNYQPAQEVVKDVLNNQEKK